MTIAKLTPVAVALAAVVVIGGTAVALKPTAAAQPIPAQAAVAANGPATATPSPAPGKDYPKLSPFTAVRWTGYQVQVNGRWYELVSLNDQTMEDVIKFAQKTYDDMWQKRIDEDLVQVLSEMGHPPGNTIKLQLRTLDTHEMVTLASVPMSESNRRAVWMNSHPSAPAAGGVGRPVDRHDKLSPFTAVRWKGVDYQVQINGDWYSLQSIDDQPIGLIVEFAKKNYGTMWHKRIDEDLVEVLFAMGNPPNENVRLELQKLDSGEMVTLENIPMTPGNREVIRAQRQKDGVQN